MGWLACKIWDLFATSCLLIHHIWEQTGCTGCFPTQKHNEGFPSFSVIVQQKLCSPFPTAFCLHQYKRCCSSRPLISRQFLVPAGYDGGSASPVSSFPHGVLKNSIYSFLSALGLFSPIEVLERDTLLNLYLSRESLCWLPLGLELLIATLVRSPAVGYFSWYI